MPEQLTVFGETVHTEDLELGRAQRAVMGALREHPNLTADEAGAAIHQLRGKHSADERCAFCGSDGDDILDSLRARGRLDEDAVRGAAASSSSGPASPSSEVLTARARSTDPATSHAAAASLGDLRPSQAAVLALFQELGPMADEALLISYRERAVEPSQSDSGLRSRRAELVDQGLLEDSGERGLTGSGRATIVWRIPAASYDPASAAIPF